MPSTSIRHAPFGANASFDFGPPGAPAGFSIPADVIPAQNVYVGCRSSDREPWSLLPFFPATVDGPRPLPSGRFGRFFALAGDKWMIGPLVFKLCTPLPADVTADECFVHAPVVCGYLEYDNSHSDDTAELIFGVSGNAARLSGHGLTGFQFENSHGCATAHSEEEKVVIDDQIFGANIGEATAFAFHVPPHSKRIYPLVIGFFRSGFYSTQFLRDLVSVLDYGLGAHSRYVALANAQDAEFMRSNLSFETKNEIARDVRQWLAQTRRRLDEEPIDLSQLRQFRQQLVATR